MSNLLARCVRFGMIVSVCVLLMTPVWAQRKTVPTTGVVKSPPASGTVKSPAAAATVCTYPTGPGTANLRLRQAMDYDLDCKADFATFRPSDSTWRIHPSSVSGTGSDISQAFGLSSQDFVTPGDFDGDGKGDISVWRDATGTWYCLNSSNGTLRTTQWGVSGDEPVARDYDGDGITDLATVRRSSGNMFWYILKSTGRRSPAVQFGLATDFTAPGDYDGDGKFDLAVQRPGATLTSPANFWWQKSADGSTQGPVQVGLSGDLVVPGDYDGDGKTDFAVVREGATPTSALTWIIHPSAGGADLTFSSGVGITGSDLNVQNDYDGDGKTDIAYWRDSTGTFFVLTAASNFTVTTQYQLGQSNDYPVASYDTH